MTNLLNELQVTEKDFDRDATNGEYILCCNKITKDGILHNQGVVNRIKIIIKEKENEVEYMEKQYPNVESELHNLHHSWKAKLDDIDMFKRLLL